MPTFAPKTASHEYSATLRQLKVLVIVLVLSNIGLGVFAVYLLHSIDQRYSTLLGRSLPVLNDFRELTAGLGDTMRATGLPLVNAAPEKRNEATQRAKESVMREREFLETVMKDPLPPGMPDGRAEIAGQSQRFEQLADQVIALAAKGDTATAIKVRENELRAAFDDYVASIAKAAAAIEGASLKASDEMSARTGSMSTVMLGLAGWPVIVLIALLVLTAVFVVVLMVLFRGREMSDMP